jgi:hypothetical protein
MDPFPLVLALSVSAVAFAAPAAGRYRLLQEIPVASDEGWDHRHPFPMICKFSAKLSNPGQAPN